MEKFDEHQMLLESSTSLTTPAEDEAQKRITHIYDDSNKFLDYLASRLRYDMSKERQLIFISQNITLDAFIKHFFVVDSQELILYDVNYFYEPMAYFITMFAQPYSESLMRLVEKYKCNVQSTTVVLDFGSFFQSAFSFQDYLDFVYNLPPSPLIITALDSGLLSPAELGLALAYCPNIAINNQFMRPPVAQRYTGLSNTYSATNSALLAYTQSLARAERNDVLSSIQSQLRLRQVISREDLDRELGERAWQVTDRDAQYHSSSKDLQAVAQLDLTSPRAARRVMSRKSIINFKTAPEQPQQPEEKDIEIRLE